MTVLEPKGSPRTRRRLGLLALLAVPVGLILAACGSMSKNTLRAELEALDKNGPLADLGLRSLEVELDLGDGPTALSALYAFVPARD
ncbi:MAG: hypothetical protein P1V81_10660, partial [Planctomycetota bacterium]|nr:hypothetical protein [Planctomycetota bacterium]